jgi:hypothetical protein
MVSEGGIYMDNPNAEQIFNEIYNRTYTELSTYVISRIRNIDDAKDLLQITYTSFYKRLLKKGAIPADDETLKKDKSYKQEEFQNFDFETIWVMKDGVPKLRIFE